MSGASTSTYPENLGSGGLLPAELRGRVCLFVRLFFSITLRCYRHRKPRRFVYALKLGGTDISPPDTFSFSSSFHFRSLFRSRSSSSSTTSGDIFYCSGSRQLNHSSYVAAKATYIRLLRGKIGILEGFFGPSSVHRGRTHIVLG